MCEQFIKIKCIPFPNRPKNGYSGWSESARSIREKIVIGFEAWLIKLLGDEVICESRLLVQFLNECGDIERSNEKIDIRRRTRSELIGGKLLTVMKAAKSVVKTVASSAGNQYVDIKLMQGKLAVNVPGKMVGFVDGIADQLMNDTTPESPNLRRSTFSKDEQIDQINETDLEIILECVFTTVEEAFNLSDPDQWVRQKGLQFVKKLLRRTFGESITTTLQTAIQTAKTPQKSSEIINALITLLWPDDIFFQSTNRIIRSDQEKLDTKLEAKKLFVHGRLLPTDALVHIVGKFNTVNGLTRIFNMVQDQRLNRVLIAMWLDNTIRTLFDSS